MVKGFQCHSNNSLQLLELKGKKQQQNNTRYLNVLGTVYIHFIHSYSILVHMLTHSSSSIILRDYYVMRITFVS